jgi:transposase-like protein
VPKAYPKEFREDVVRVFRESDSTIEQVAKDFGVSASCLQRWLAQDEKARGGSGSSGSGRPVASESVELRDAKKRIRLLEQENEVLRKAAAYFAQANLPGK